MKKRLIKNYVTTIIGVAVLGFAAWQYHETKDYTAAAGWCALGLVFLRSKDSLIGILEK
jgi:hypothetical protein